MRHGEQEERQEQDYEQQLYKRRAEDTTGPILRLSGWATLIVVGAVVAVLSFAVTHFIDNVSTNQQQNDRLDQLERFTTAIRTEQIANTEWRIRSAQTEQQLLEHINELNTRVSKLQAVVEEHDRQASRRRLQNESLPMLFPPELFFTLKRKPAARPPYSLPHTFHTNKEAIS